MKFSIGRSNLALTIFVPFDCKNNCKFCTSKENYKINKPSVDNVRFQVKRFFKDFDYPITDVVFTGGEPMQSITVLKDLIKLIPSQYNIYINTTLINKNLNSFIDLVNKTEKIKGVNISRHGESYEDDKKVFCDIAEDEKIALFEKPIRINCVLQGQDIKKVIDRWDGKGFELSFRKDFRIEQNDVELHNPYDETALAIISLGYKFAKHTFCKVCDTTTFEKNGNIVSYHKGKQSSSIKNESGLEINDFIIKQNGFLTYDWEADDIETIDAIEKQFRVLIRPLFPLPSYFNGCGMSQPIHYCGGSSCGGGGC